MYFTYQDLMSFCLHLTYCYFSHATINNLHDTPIQPVLLHHVDTCPPLWDWFHVSTALNVLSSRIAG